MKWTQSSDVFSFGSLTFEVLHEGRLPFEHFTSEALLQFYVEKIQPVFPALFDLKDRRLTATFSPEL